MAFFNKVGETLSNKGRDVAKKAKELAEISSLNGQISSQEENISRIFREIGRVFYEQHRDSADELLSEKCKSIDAAYEEIERLKKEIMVVKGAKECPSCHAEVASQSAFCPSCGAKMPIVEAEPAQQPEEAEAPQESVCPDCGCKTEADALFCPECGNKLKDAESNTPQ